MSSLSTFFFRRLVSYGVLERGQLFTKDYRCYVTANGEIVSPWHDIPLVADADKKHYNMVVEIPRWTNAKMEMATKESASPIRQDEKNGAPRFVHNIFPHKGYPWNYGALPQTWEDPEVLNPDTKALGDNDPIDVLEIGDVVHTRGAVVQVKIVGALALIDEGETDWKLVGIDVNDPLAKDINSTADVERLMPGYLRATYEWLRVYKVPAGKPVNKFGFDGEFQSAEFAHKVIEETHEHWKKLIRQVSPKLNTQSLHTDAAHAASQEEWKKEAGTHGLPTDQYTPADFPRDVDKKNFVIF